MLKPSSSKVFIFIPATYEKKRFSFAARTFEKEEWRIRAIIRGVTPTPSTQKCASILHSIKDYVSKWLLINLFKNNLM